MAGREPAQVVREDLVADCVHIAAVETVIHPLDDRNEVLPALIAWPCRAETVMHLLKGRNISGCHSALFPIHFGSCFSTRSARKRHNSRAPKGHASRPSNSASPPLPQWHLCGSPRQRAQASVCDD